MKNKAPVLAAILFPNNLAIDLTSLIASPSTSAIPLIISLPVFAIKAIIENKAILKVISPSLINPP